MGSSNKIAAMILGKKRPRKSKPAPPRSIKETVQAETLEEG